jgi:hypothetical protein
MAAVSAADGTPRARQAVGAGAGVGVGGERRDSRVPSFGRDRAPSATQRGFSLDPGAVFEALGNDEDEGGEGVEEQRGTLRERFVPPHVFARKESAQSGV